MARKWKVLDLPPNTTYRLERTCCGKAACRSCGGFAYTHGPYWYAYWPGGVGGKLKSRYIGKRPPAEVLAEEKAQAETDARAERERARASARPRDLGGDDWAACGTDRSASWVEAQASFRRLALRLHPDRGGDLRQMQDLNAAWDRLRSFYGK